MLHLLFSLISQEIGVTTRSRGEVPSLHRHPDIHHKRREIDAETRESVEVRKGRFQILQGIFMQQAQMMAHLGVDHLWLALTDRQAQR